MVKKGRPTKWTPEINDRLVKWFDVPPYKDVEIPHYKKGELDYTDIKRMPNKLPWMHRFEMKEGLSVGTCSRWADDADGKNKYPGFFEAYNQAKLIYKEFLIENGLNGLYPPASFIFTAKNTTTMRDTIENDVVGDILIKWKK